MRSPDASVTRQYCRPVNSTINHAQIFDAYTIAKRNAELSDVLFRNTTGFFAFLVFAILAGIVITLLIGSLPAIKTFGFGFLFSSEWNPVTDQFGALVPIVGTLVTSIIALLIGIPVSFGIALFITEMSPRWLAPARHRGGTAGRHPEHHLRHVGPVRLSRGLRQIVNPGSPTTSAMQP